MAQKLPPFFGLNIGKDKLKIAEVELISEDKAKLKYISSHQSSVALVSNESEEGEMQLANEIIKCVKSSGTNTKNCVISLSELSVYSRLLTLPKMKEEELEEAVHYALKPLIPVPIEGVNISFLEVDEVKTQFGQMINIYSVAAPKLLVDRYVRILAKAGLNLLAIETESLSIARMIFFTNKIPQGKNVLIMDVGAENTNIIIARNSVVIFSQSISTGSNAMTKVIASDFGIDQNEANKYKIAYGLDPSAGEGKIAKSIEPVAQIIVSEASRTLSYLREKIGGDSVSSVFLTGGGSGLKGFDKFCKDKLGLETVIVNPLNNLEIDSKLAGLVQSMETRGFNVAIGQALKQN